jgi:hypothetical protein
MGRALEVACRPIDFDSNRDDTLVAFARYGWRIASRASLAPKAPLSNGRRSQLAQV